MTLLDTLKDLLNTLSAHGWHTLFEAHGLNIQADDLATELTRDLSQSINREFPGFEDFSLEGKQAIEPGHPARSLLYHALASPNVQWYSEDKTQVLQRFPDLHAISQVENYIYASKQLSLQSLQDAWPDHDLAVVVFSHHYRQATEVPHGKHADMVYSRTGIARIGNTDSKYNEQTRCFNPLSDNPYETRTLPAQYHAYLAVALKGSQALLGNRFQTSALPIGFSDKPADDALDFWYPVHKLFAGDECLIGTPISLTLTAQHRNEKIRKIHAFVNEAFHQDSGSTEEQQHHFPFDFTENIADFDPAQSLVIPVTHTALVEAAYVDNTPVTLKKTFDLPMENDRYQINNRGNSIAMFSSSMEFRAAGAADAVSSAATGAERSVPEYAHVRTRIDGEERTDMNHEDDIIASIATDHYNALHYVDYSGDGSVSVSSNLSTLAAYPHISAYSIIAPPDYFPFCHQSTIFDADIPMATWSRAPQTLADTRLRPNIQSHPDLLFTDMGTFDTCTALIAGTQDNALAQTQSVKTTTNTVSYLSDAAAGVFAPGWDTSFDMQQVDGQSIPHLSAYGLGSPFPEDAKLCAAISSFWPAVAPDIARSFWPEALNRKTVIPLTDEEIGSNGKPGWDGEQGPVQLSAHGQTRIRYKKFAYVDYTRNALNNRFNYHQLAQIDTERYLDRVRKYALAESRMMALTSKRPILVSYRITGDAGNNKHHYQFMTDFELIKSTQDTVELALLNSTHLVITADNQINVT